jgi:CubicO group peptidase (beta-lactamase class C family)
MAAALFLTSLPASAQQPGAARDSVDARVMAFMAERQIPGAAVAILEDGRLVKARGYGLADVEHSVPATAETLFQSGSLGKQFTAAAVLLLAEEGRLSLDDPITHHLADAPATWGTITIHHLLSHTGGLGGYERRVDLRRDYSEEELVREIAAAPLEFEPGSEWSYSNSGYLVLGAIVSHVTGAHWGEYLKNRVFEPAGMETAQVISEADIVPHRASGYRLEDGELKNQEWVSPSFLSTGDGALYVSILDLARWDQALRRGAVLSPDSRRAMWTPTRLADGAIVGYGFGWGVAGPPARPHVGHGGAWQGFKAYILRYDDPAVTVALLTNGAQADPHVMTYAIAAAYRPELAQPTPGIQPLSDAALAMYAGSYRLPSGDTVHVRVEDHVLMVEGLGRRPVRFEPIGDDVFVRSSPDERLRFVRGAAGFEQAWLGAPGAPVLRLRRIP